MILIVRRRTWILQSLWILTPFRTYFKDFTIADAGLAQTPAVWCLRSPVGTPVTSTRTIHAKDLPLRLLTMYRRFQPRLFTMRRVL
jgi:hypothetical protein